MIQAIREWWYKRCLLDKKLRAMYEIAQDVNYIRTCRNDMLYYDEQPARRRLAVLKSMPERNEKEEAEFDAIIDTLADSKSVKNEYEKSLDLLGKLENYISCLKSR